MSCPKCQSRLVLDELPTNRTTTSRVYTFLCGSSCTSYGNMLFQTQVCQVAAEKNQVETKLALTQDFLGVLRSLVQSDGGRDEIVEAIDAFMGG